MFKLCGQLSLPPLHSLILIVTVTDRNCSLSPPCPEAVPNDEGNLFSCCLSPTLNWFSCTCLPSNVPYYSASVRGSDSVTGHLVQLYSTSTIRCQLCHIAIPQLSAVTVIVFMIQLPAVTQPQSTAVHYILD